MPKYVFNLNNYHAVDYLDNVFVKSKKVLMVLDSQWEHRAKSNMLGAKMIESYRTYSKDKIATFGGNGAGNYNVSIFEFDSSK